MIVPFESAVKRFHSKDHAVTALTPPDMPGRRSHDPRYTTIRDATPGRADSSSEALRSFVTT